jgi:drug/metabolite transporter (DMT)-like permease
VSEHPRATAALTATALVAFAANSLLCRSALRPGLVDAATFTSVRLASGALALSLIAWRRGRLEAHGSLASTFALFGYAAAFSFAYLRLAAGTGALILFGSVQATMVGSGLVFGERPRLVEWVGLAIAIVGLVLLVRPGATAPDALGAGLMALAGAAWGAYSLRGRGGRDPVAANARNFVGSLPLALLTSVVTLRSLHASAAGVVLAAVSGALTSGVGYAVWYAALRGLTATRAAIVQLAVPVLAAVGGVVVLGETISVRLVGCAALVLGGVALAVSARAAR